MFFRKRKSAFDRAADQHGQNYDDAAGMRMLAWFLFVAIIAVCLALIGSAVTADASPRIAAIAMKYEGLHERNNYKLVKALVGHSPTRIPWCSSFTCAVVKKAGYHCPIGYRSARSFLKWGVPVSPKNARKGDIVVFSRSRGKGHNGVFLGWYRGKMKVISGNSRNQVRVGYYSTKRLLGVRRAF